jgi:hypothetical protein
MAITNRAGGLYNRSQALLLMIESCNNNLDSLSILYGMPSSSSLSPTTSAGAVGIK